MVRNLVRQILPAKNKFESNLRNILGYSPGDLNLYKTALSHRSIKEGSDQNNERLEFLGDAVLSAVVADYLFKKYPYKEEGFITELRSRIVNRKSLNEVGTRLGLVDKLKYNRKSMNEVSKDLAGNTFEALVGAVYLDAGFDETKRFIQKRVLTNLIDIQDLIDNNTDYKSQIYHYVQREGKAINFKVGEEKMKNRRAYFVIHLEIDGAHIAMGEGFSKKVAEQNAAMNAIKQLGIEGKTE